jgi:uncharacterized protein (DUF58 family)
MNNKTLLLLVIILGMLLIALMTKNGDLAWMALPFLVYLAVGILQAPNPNSVHLDAARKLNETMLEGKSTVEMEITVSNNGGVLDNLFLFDPLPEGIQITNGYPRQRLALRSGEDVIMHYSCSGYRGQYSWKIIRAIASDPLGLFETEISLPATADHFVAPEYSKFQRLNIYPSGTLHSPGPIPARLAGSGTDFFGVREYHPGDSLRWLDWRLIARHPHQYFTKEFEQEEIADIGLILDARQKSYLQLDGKNLFEYAISAVSSLAEVFLQRGHRVSMVALNKNIVTIYPGYGKRQLNRIFRCLSTMSVGTNSTISRLDTLPLRIFSRHALMIIISPWINDDVPFFRRLRASGYQVLLISPDPVEFSASLYAKDPVNQLAVRATRLERRLKLREITQLQIKVIDWPVNLSLYPLVRDAIGHTRGQREL